MSVRRYAFASMMLLASRLAPVTEARNIAVFYALETDRQMLEDHAGSLVSNLAVGRRTVYQINLFTNRIHAVRMERGVIESAVSAEALLVDRRNGQPSARSG